MVQVVHLNRGLWTWGPHNFTDGRGGQKGFKWNDFEL